MSGVLWFLSDIRPDLDPPKQGSFGKLIHDSAPTTWTENGLGWSVASDLTTAISNLPQTPGIAASTAGAMAVHYSAPLPLSNGGEEFEWVIASSRTAAESEWSGNRPAVLWSADGDHVAKVA